MAWLIGGALNALERTRHFRTAEGIKRELGKATAFGLGTIWHRATTWVSHLTTPFEVVGGFLFGADRPTPQLVTAPAGAQGTDYEQSILAYQRLYHEAVTKEMDALRAKTWGVVTLNISRFNEGLVMDKVAQHARAKAEHFTLPTKDGGPDPLRALAGTPPTPLTPSPTPGMSGAGNQQSYS